MPHRKHGTRAEVLAALEGRVKEPELEPPFDFFLLCLSSAPEDERSSRYLSPNDFMVLSWALCLPNMSNHVPRDTTNQWARIHDRVLYNG